MGAIGAGARLVVARGPDAGTQLIVNDQVKIVGRSRDAHLVLTDETVSRHHFHVHATEHGVYVRACEGAAPLTVHEREVLEADVSIGDSIVVGDTVMVVVRVLDEDAGAGPVSYRGTTMNLPALLSGEAAEVRALAAVFALNRAIANVESISQLEAALEGWARTHLACTGATFDVADRPAPPSGLGAEDAVHIFERRDGELVLHVPCPGAPTGWLAFTTNESVDRVRDSLRRLLVLAGALCASRFAQMASLREAEEERDTYRKRIEGTAHTFLGLSPGAREVARAISKLSVSDYAVLLLGEGGAGKNFVARLIHESGPRKNELFRIVNCATLTEGIAENALQGGGTLILDEIGDLPLASQAKLHHALERAIPMQARIIATTKRDLTAMIDAGTFRRDLYFHISSVTCKIPPLRERPQDIAMVARQVLDELAAAGAGRARGLSEGALELLRGYAWPGNVRELRVVIEHALILSDGPRLEAKDFPAVTTR
ncbi:sigma 54-interacting transcriptional regulator [Pendulispora rubella]|uniref:Sigma 54-interacting transcriptional regulator n=1 Tax=Pendulispora rubella TaxID=2741070 RepID=A0ABZ2LP75_9BACT